MKNWVFIITLVISATVNAQSLELGLLDNQYMHVDYVDKNDWLMGYEQSLLNVAMKEQSG